jgi:hypothetical protein
MPRKPYVQFSGWAFVGAALSRLIDRWHNRRRPRRIYLEGIGWAKTYGQPQHGETKWAGLERGLWLERNDDDA